MLNTHFQYKKLAATRQFSKTNSPPKSQSSASNEINDSLVLSSSSNPGSGPSTEDSLILSPKAMAAQAAEKARPTRQYVGELYSQANAGVTVAQAASAAISGGGEEVAQSLLGQSPSPSQSVPSPPTVKPDSPSDSGPQSAPAAEKPPVPATSHQAKPLLTEQGQALIENIEQSHMTDAEQQAHIAIVENQHQVKPESAKPPVQPETPENSTHAKPPVNAPEKPTSGSWLGNLADSIPKPGALLNSLGGALDVFGAGYGVNQVNHGTQQALEGVNNNDSAQTALGTTNALAGAANTASSVASLAAMAGSAAVAGGTAATAAVAAPIAAATGGLAVALTGSAQVQENWNNREEDAATGSGVLQMVGGSAMVAGTAAAMTAAGTAGAVALGAIASPALVAAGVVFLGGAAVVGAATLLSDTETMQSINTHVGEFAHDAVDAGSSMLEATTAFFEGAFLSKPMLLA